MKTLIETKKTPRRSVVMQLLAFLLLLLGSHSAIAADCSGSGGSAVITLPATTIVPRDIAVGQPLSAWVTASSSQYYSCYYPTSPTGQRYYRGIMARNPTLGSLGSSYYDSTTGQTYALLSTGVTGVGMAVRIYSSGSVGACYYSSYLDASISGNTPGGGRRRAARLLGGFKLLELWPGYLRFVQRADGSSTCSNRRNSYLW